MKKSTIKRAAGVLATLLVILLLTACGGSGSSSGSTTASAPAAATTAAATAAPAASAEEVRDADAYLSAIGDEPNVVDVVRFIGIADRNVFYNVLEPLVRIVGGIVTPAGAESWQISEDGLTYTFTLRDNYWSDGQKVTSYEYANVLYRQADPANAFAFASDIYCIENFEAIFTGNADISTLGVETPDEKTLILHLSEPSPALLSTFEFYPERADYVEKYGDRLGTEAETVASCGPFVLDGWVHNSELNYSKNEYYWDAENVGLDKLDLLIITDSAAQYAAFLSGEVDMLRLSDSENIASLRLDGSYIETPITGTRTYMMIFNGRDSLFQNEKVRLAFSLAFDREGIANDLYDGLMTPAYGLIPAACSVGSYNYREAVPAPLLELADQDPAALLREGLAELGLSEDPSELTITLSFGSTSASMRLAGEYYQQMLQDVLGVRIELSMNNVTTHLANIRQGSFQIAMSSWGANLEPQFQLTRFVGGGQHKKDNPEYDELVMEAVVELDDAVRLEKYAAAEKELIQSAMIAPLYFAGSVRFSNDYVRGLWTNEFDTTGYKTAYTSGR